MELVLAWLPLLAVLGVIWWLYERGARRADELRRRTRGEAGRANVDGPFDGGGYGTQDGWGGPESGP